MGFQSHESQTSCVVQETSTLHFDSSVSTRRKRRLVKKLPSSPATRVLNLSHQAVLKRAGARPVHCSPLHRLDGVVNEEYDCEFPDLLAKLSDERGLSKIVRSGLARSRSFPPEGWQTGKYVLQICKMGRPSVERGVRSHGTVVKEKASPASDTTSASCITDVKHATPESVCFSYPPLSEADSSVEQAGSPDYMSIDSPPHDKDSSMGMVVDDHQVDSNVASEAIDDGVCSSVRTGPSQNVEGNFSIPLAQAQVNVKQTNVRDSIPSGKVLICGRRREMEDQAVIAPFFAQVPQSKRMDGRMIDLHFYGVYDGHGGSQASNFCTERLHHTLAEEIVSSTMNGDTSNSREWQSIMSSCFMKVDKEVGGVCPYGVCDVVDSSAGCCVGSIAPDNAGTTAVVAVVSASQIILANCGDSRAVLSRAGKATPLSQDHKPERADETSRIEAAGGQVIFWKGFRVGALLALSRAIGDRYLKRYVISEPDVTCLQRSEEDECLILASDGLWDVLDNETACNVARRCLASAREKEPNRVTSKGDDYASASAAATLVKLAYAKGSQDNISVVVIDLSPRRK